MAYNLQDGEFQKHDSRFSVKNGTAHMLLGSGGEVVRTPPLNRKVGYLRPTMIRAHCACGCGNISQLRKSQKTACYF